MTFNDNAKIDSSKVTRRKRNAGIGVGVGGVGAIAIFLISSFLGVDLSGIAGGLQGGGAGSEEEVVTDPAECDTGQEANASVDCRMGGAADSLDTYWAAELPELGIDSYSTPEFVLFDAATDTGCGAASSSTGPFYCPPDTTLYVDTTFFEELRTRFGANGGPLAEMYVVAHEWGHHIQNLTGVLAQAQDGDTGPDSASVRVELQADCFAGAWAGAASDTTDANGTPFLKTITDAQIADALSAASAVGDDSIQGTSANSDTWTHGSSEQRQRWFTNGYQGGPESCDTFAVGTP